MIALLKILSGAVMLSKLSLLQLITHFVSSNIYLRGATFHTPRNKLTWGKGVSALTQLKIERL